MLPYAFCFNFLEATGSISFASPSPLFFSLSLSLFLSSLSPSLGVPLSAVTASAATARRFLVGAPRNVPRWFSALWMLLGIYPHSPSLSYPSPIAPCSPAFLRPPTPPLASPNVPTAPCLSLSFPSHSVYPFLAMRSLMPPPLGAPRSKGLNRPVQFPTSSVSSPRSRPAIAHVVVATSRVIFLSPELPRDNGLSFSLYLSPSRQVTTVLIQPTE